MGLGSNSFILTKLKGRIVLRVEEISKFLREGRECLSEPVHIRGFDWKLKVFSFFAMYFYAGKKNVDFRAKNISHKKCGSNKIYYNMSKKYFCGPWYPTIQKKLFQVETRMKSTRDDKRIPIKIELLKHNLFFESKW